VKKEGGDNLSLGNTSVTRNRTVLLNKRGRRKGKGLAGKRGKDWTPSREVTENTEGMAGIPDRVSIG